jgi:hypothetical protein
VSRTSNTPVAPARISLPIDFIFLTWFFETSGGEMPRAPGFHNGDGLFLFLGIKTVKQDVHSEKALRNGKD